MNNLECILKDLNQHKRNKNELIIFYINERLTKSLKSYYDELSVAVNYLNKKDEISLLRKMNRYE